MRTALRRAPGLAGLPPARAASSACPRAASATAMIWTLSCRHLLSRRSCVPARRRSLGDSPAPQTPPSRKHFHGPTEQEAGLGMDSDGPRSGGSAEPPEGVHSSGWTLGPPS